MGYLKASDRIVLNRFELLHIAKEEAKALIATAYRPPLHPRQIPVAGRTGIATLKAAMVNMLEGGFISEYDYNIGSRIAEIMCGGDVEAGSMVDEDWLLDLERKHFLELVASEKTQETSRVHVEAWEAAAELMKNCCARHNCVAQGFGMGLELILCVNSASSSFRAAFCHRSRRFYMH